MTSNDRHSGATSATQKAGQPLRANRRVTVWGYMAGLSVPADVALAVAEFHKSHESALTAITEFSIATILGYAATQLFFWLAAHGGRRTEWPLIASMMLLLIGSARYAAHVAFAAVLLGLLIS